MRAALLLGVAACGTHVQVRAPAQNITPTERVAMFKALERADQETVQVSYNHGPWQMTSTTLILADGTRVELPEDLLSVVPPDSDTAKAARASASALHASHAWKAVAYGVAIVGFGVLIANFKDESPAVDEDYVFGATAAGFTIPYIVSAFEHHEAMNLRMQAFSTYTRDLGVRLDVCAHGLEVVACETVPSAYPPAPATAAPSPYPPANAPTPSSPPAPAASAPATTQPAPAPSGAPAPTQPAPAQTPPAQSPIVDPFAPAP